MNDNNDAATPPKPLFDTVILVEDKQETETANGVFLPQGHIDNGLRRGTIVAVGPGTSYPDGTTVPLTVMEGERVVFGRLSGVSIKYAEGEYLVVAEKDILCIVGD
jgi:chaperonin GroES